VTAVAVRGELVERDGELKLMSQLTAAAASGSGQLLVLEGEAGIGKTRLLENLSRSAQGQGFRALVAVGGEFESDAALLMVRQLFERPLMKMSRVERTRSLAGAARLSTPLFGSARPKSAPIGGSQSSLWHGLYWLVANLAEQTPLLIVVDDAHWSDAASGVWLLYLARRLSDLPLLLALGVRSTAPAPDWLTTLQGLPLVTHLRLKPLGQDGTTRLVGAELGASVSDEFSSAFHAATGGNPFLVGELARAMSAEEVAPSSANAERVRDFSPQSITRYVLARLGRLPAPAVEMARAVAVLGASAQLRHAAALAQIDRGAAVAAVDSLVAAGIFQPSRLAFAHPIMRTVLYNDLAGARRSQAHSKAASILAATGAQKPSVAAHLLLAEPGGDAETVRLLRDAAREAISEGVPTAATTYLRRALTEPPAAAERGEVLRELGSAELVARVPEAAEHLAQALAATGEIGKRAEISLQLGQAEIAGGRLPRAGRVLDAALQELADSDADIGLSLEVYRSALGIWHPQFASDLEQRLPRLRELTQRGGPASRPLYLLLAFHAAFGGEPPATALELVRRALGNDLTVGPAPEDAIELVMWAPRTLTFIDELSSADHVISELVQQAQASGSTMIYAAASAWRADLEFRRGSVAAAEAEARTAVDLVAQHDVGIIRPQAHTFLAEALLERGLLAEAAATLQACRLEAMAPTRPGSRLLHNMGCVRLAQGDREGAIRDLRASQEVLESFGLGNPNVLPYRSRLALALGSRSPDEARSLIEIELKLARNVGQERAIGVALRAQGLLAPRDEGIELLRSAVASLERCPSRLEQARAFIDLGGALRRANHPRDARDPLRDGLDLAHRSGAIVLANLARQELVAAGGRPRRPVMSGTDSLTPAELRVARMACEGTTNREIAQALFLSTNTVATHLSHVFQKLHLTGRSELSATLNGD
jgi:DNA-binding CsgD family transcriptional regulator